ncbi:transcriptional regulator [Burkholderia sp. Leaf177]|uniref:anti-sigma factor family protein n=1 Tax=Burkholderia sp. Leaf177 TaxID=1736287 RepID=UPI0006FF5278|nr:anti-sigma factor [Burkholderia sp. Leaf177]KQR74288.1 transcriptional regulator [Burkholderia sp. Leaf177]
MSEQQTPITEDEIHAYVDGSLAEHRREEIDRLLEHDEGLATKISDYFSLNSMFHDRYDRVLSEPVPQRLLPPERRRWRDAANWPQFAGMAAALVIGVGIGVGGMMSNVGGRALMPGSGDDGHVQRASFTPGESFARQSAVAHVMYAPEVMRPVEVGVDREQELVTWVSKRLGTDVRPPILTRVGFELMGGRLLPGDDGPVAQFMYHDAKGERITLCISHRKISSDTTAFKLYQDGSVNVFYWIDGDFGYAVSGAIDRKVLLELSHDVYSQLTQMGDVKPQTSTQ